MEHTSDIVSDGKLIHETSYPQRSAKYEELEIEGIKIDFYDVKNKIIHEVKKSDKMEPAHEWQVRYYISVLEKNGIEGVTGILEYPKLKKTSEVFLSERDRKELDDIILQIQFIAESDQCPESTRSQICKSCSYLDFCWITEET